MGGSIMEKDPATGQDPTIGQNLFSRTLPREITAEEALLVGGGFNWGAFAFVGGLALGASGGNPLVALGAGVIAGLVTN